MREEGKRREKTEPKEPTSLNKQFLVACINHQ